MIRGIFIVNNYGQPRCVKFYEAVDEATQQILIREIFLLVSKRSDNVCNFMAGDSLSGSWGKGTKLIYRHYATLFFVFACEDTESELGILDLIQVFVETLDKCFESVCELDLIFHADKVHYILDEIVMGGLVLETNMHDILVAINETNKLERSAEDTSRSASGTGGAVTKKSGPFAAFSRG
ncbi:AP-3 complex subunit sigma [Hondaea fermentalgiana]|uniref:AP complex subunit sigma n=1 Tax=Hondaea fermentalgiana TaxID=2315210 RepID=A0A2R5GNW7_9STRA|nr:AP-3 complex subunit sigma [Hondaea fermentalgiana]|eukprot:GBG30333.1 AP-3 complex subunit sigma [Hondaea fermentalgiana]